MTLRACTLVALTLVCLVADQAAANSLPFQTTVRVGLPAREVSLRVANVDEGVELVLGTARHTVTGVTASAVASEVVSLSGGASVLLLTFDTGPDARLVVAGLRQGRVAILWNDRIGLRGDPGERRGYILARVDRDGDGVSELGFVEQHEQVRSCSNTLVGIRARWLNPKTLTLEPVHQVVEPSTPGSRSVPLPVSPMIPDGFAQHPHLGVLTARWTDAQAALETLAPLPDGSPLLDRNAETGIALPPRGTTRMTFGVLAGGMAARALAITTGDAAATGAAREVTVQGDEGPEFHVTLPARPAGTRHWIALPAGSAWRCLEITAGPGAALTMSEVELFTDLDAPDGLSVLTGRVVTDDRNGTEAARVLAALGKPGIDALANAWERLGPRGKRRAVFAVRDQAATSTEARSLLARAVRDTDAELREPALASLMGVADAAFPELIALATSDGPGTDAAIGALAKMPRTETATALLGLLTHPTRAKRKAATDALELVTANGSEHVVTAVRSWLASAPPRAAQTLALAPLASAPATRPSALAIWTAIAPQSDLEFEDLWRLVNGTAALDPSAAVDAWLAHLAEHDDRWMLRDAALAALRARSSDQTLSVAIGRLDDDYPRVRARAIAAVAAYPGEQSKLQGRFSTETWPMVRAAIVTEVATPNESRTLRSAALKDAAPQVRIAAIAATERLGDTSLWLEIGPLVRSNNEWPAVIGAAIQLASTRCITDATPDLRVVLKRGLKPDAWAPDVDLAMQAIDTLGRFGTADAKALLRAAQSPEQPPAVRDAAARASNQPSCQPNRGPSAGAAPAPSPPPIATETTAQ